MTQTLLPAQKDGLGFMIMSHPARLPFDRDPKGHQSLFEQLGVIRRQDRDIAVVLSMADYERLRSGNIQAFLDLRDQVAAEAAANGLTEERLNELLADDDA